LGAVILSLFSRLSPQAGKARIEYLLEGGGEVIHGQEPVGLE
jgi:hypothetical protein